MNKIDEKKYKILIHKLGLKYKLPDNILKELVESPYEFSANKIKGLNLDEVISEEEVNNIKTNFMYTGFGKLFLKPVSIKKLIKYNINKK